jgi:branched-chain amino acid transport system permease protein
MEIAIICLLNGISFGSILFLLASGLSLILGVMGILNLAHGALYMIGAYVGWTVAEFFGLDFWAAALIAAILVGLVGLAIQRGFLVHLHRLLTAQVLLTIGFVYIIGNLSLWIWGSIVKPPFTAPYLGGTVALAGWPYPISRIVIIAVGLVLSGGLWWLQDKTRIGAIVRAGIDNGEMTRGLGINLGLVNSILFFVGAAVAGFAGVIGAQIMGASLDLGLDVLLLSLIVVVIGGMGSVQGAFLGAMIIGVVDAFGKVFFPELAMFTMYIVMIIVLLTRPAGLMGRRL